MARIIIQGSKEETNKTIIALKDTFGTVSKKTSLQSDNSFTSIIDVELQAYEKIHGYTHEEIMKGLECCSCKTKRCNECPFLKEEECSTTCITLASVCVNKMLQEASKK